MSDATPKTSEPSNVIRLAQFARRMDGWQNAFTGLGTYRDKRTTTLIGATEKIPFETLREMYRSDFLTARAIERPVADMVREWFDVQIQDEKDMGESCDGWLADLKTRPAVDLALNWQRAYGGAGIFLGINKDKPPTAEQLAKPLNPGDIKSIDHLTVFSCRELQTIAYYADPLRPNFGTPASYRIVPQVPFGISGQRIMNFGATIPLPEEVAGAPTHPWSILPEVHESWFLKFDGVLADRRQRLENWGWGDAIVQRWHDLVRDVGATWGSLANLLQDFAQGQFTMPGLLAALGEDNEDLIKKRLEFLDATRSNLRMLALDGGNEQGEGAETFKRDVAPLTGAADVVQLLFSLMSCAADMPQTLLFGEQAKGLNNGGDATAADWRDHVKAKQQKEMVPQIEQLLTLGMRATEGPTGGRAFPRKAGKALWSIALRPLRQLDEQEQADVRKTMSETDTAYFNMGALQPDEIRNSRFGGDGYQIETQLDDETREAFDAPPPEGAEDETAHDINDPLAKNRKPAQEPEQASTLKPGEAVGKTADNLQSLALNGTQITGLLAITAAVRDGSLPHDAAILILLAAFPYTLDEAKARTIVEKIEVKEPPPPPDPLELAKAKATGRPLPLAMPKPGEGAPPFGKG